MALIPPFFLDCVVAFGKKNPDGTVNWFGSGFLFGKFVEQIGDNEKKYETYCVTNKHVLQNQDQIVLRFNSKDNTLSKDYDISLINGNEAIWIGHQNPNIDVAVFAVNTQILDEENMQYAFFTSDSNVFKKDDLLSVEASEGDFIYVLGFPLGIVDASKKHVILRSGVIARVRDLLEGHSSNFIIDASVFPGNSGGPVILKPEFLGIEGTKINSRAALIGIVKSYIPYQDIAISPQTNRPRIVFEENSGLAYVEPVDYIFETIEEYKRIKVNNATS